MLDVETITPTPSQNPFAESARRFLSVNGNYLAEKRILICGDNVAALTRALLQAGAKVEIATGLPKARQRAQRLFPDLTVLLRDERFTEEAQAREKYDLIVLWDGFGPGLNYWVEIMGMLGEQVWADVMGEGWRQVTSQEESFNFFPDAAVRAAAARPADEVTDPLLVHVHVPKNGGSSTNDVLFESFGYRYVPQYAANPGVQHLADFFETKVPQIPQAQVIASHSFRAFPARVGPRPLLHVTFLRHSIARHLSYFRYAKKHYHAFAPEHIQTLPPGFLEMSAKDYLEFEAGVANQGYPLGQICTFDTKGDLERAKDVLEGFFMVGVVEQLDRGLALLRKKLKAVDLHLIDLSAGRANTTEDLYDETGGMLEDPATLKAASYLQTDLDLYNWAKQRFERECVMYGV